MAISRTHAPVGLASNTQMPAGKHDGRWDYEGTPGGVVRLSEVTQQTQNVVAEWWGWELLSDGGSHAERANKPAGTVVVRPYACLAATLSTILGQVGPTKKENAESREGFSNRIVAYYSLRLANLQG
jgi:hypothetical protein